MTQQVIDIGSAPDDGTGDPLRTSFDKTNENFTELYAKGATEGLWNYNKTSTDTSTAPVLGRFKTNSGNYRDATQIAINAITIQGIDRSSTLRTLLIGDLIQCQDSTNPAAWCRFGLQSLPVDHGTWFQLNVTYQADGGVASGDNQEIVFVFTASSGSAAAGAPIGAEYITSTANATLTAERVLTDTATVTWDRTTAGQIKATAVGSAAVATLAMPQGRLTLQTATPVMTTTQAAKTTLLYSPYCGDRVPIYDGASFSMSAFSELSALTTDATKSPAAIGASKLNDWYVWSDAGTLRLGHGPDWTNDTTRSAGTALVMVNGILLNAVAISNGPAIQRGTYVGTTRSNASSSLDFILGGIAVGGTAGLIGIWNTYNRQRWAAFVADNTDSWTYTTAAWQAANNQSKMNVAWVTGLDEGIFQATYNAIAYSTANTARTGIGLDSNTAPTFGSIGNAGSASANNAPAMLARSPGLGYHFVYAIEFGATGVTFYGDAGVATLQSGLHVWGEY